jgi:hypothetical protein
MAKVLVKARGRKRRPVSEPRAKMGKNDTVRTNRAKKSERSHFLGGFEIDGVHLFGGDGRSDKGLPHHLAVETVPDLLGIPLGAGTLMEGCQGEPAGSGA